MEFRSLNKRLFSNSLAQSVGKFFLLFKQILLVPLFIKCWGVGYYGEWITLASINSVFVLGDFGVGVAGSNFFVEAWMAGDRERALGFVKSTLVVITGLVLILITLVSVCLLVAGNYGVFETMLFKPDQVIQVVFLLTISSAIRFYSQAFEGAFRVSGRASRWMYLDALGLALDVLITVTVVLMGGQVVAVALGILMSSTVRGVLIVLLASSYIKTSKRWLIFSGKCDRESMVSLLRKGVGFCLVPVFNGIFFSGNVLIVRVLAGPEVVALWGAIRVLSRSVNQIIVMIEKVIVPEMQVELNRGNIDTVRSIHGMAIIVGSIIAILSIGGLGILGDEIFNLWLGGSLDFQSGVWWLLLVALLPSSIWGISASMHYASNRPRSIAIYGLGFSILSLLINISLINVVGIYSIALATVVFDMGMMFFILRSSCSYLNDKVDACLLRGWKDLLQAISNFARRTPV